MLLHDCMTAFLHYKINDCKSGMADSGLKMWKPLWDYCLLSTAASNGLGFLVTRVGLNHLLFSMQC